MSRIFKKVCNHCGNNYEATGSKQLFCNDCSTLPIKCEFCGKEFSVSRFKYEYSLRNNKGSKFNCSRKCSSSYAASFANKGRYNDYCPICEKITNHYAGGKCFGCIVNTPERLLITAEVAKKNIAKWYSSNEYKEYRSSEKAKEVSSKNITRWNNSEEGKKHNQDLLRSNHEKGDLSKFNRSEEGHAHRIKLHQENKDRFIEFIKELYSSDGMPEIGIEGTIITDISYNSFSEYDGIPGVWAIHGTNDSGQKVCLDVAQTVNIGKEMNLFIRKYLAKKSEKYKNLNGFKNLEFHIVKLGIQETEDREMTEAIYAINNQALFWHPALTQNMDNIKEVL